jgi:hypothetical protein
MGAKELRHDDGTFTPGTPLVGKTIFVRSIGGDDRNDGLRPNTAKKTAAAAHAAAIATPGIEFVYFVPEHGHSAGTPVIERTDAKG